MSPALLMAAVLALPQATARDSFPHGAHRRLFASCATCHTGISSGDSSVTRPAVASCAACHDGTRERRVTWTPAPPRPTNLRFDHRVHGRAVAARGDSVLNCVACHASPNAAAFLEAGAAKPAACLSCHAHRAPSHLTAPDCNTCHRPLRAATRLAAGDIARFSRPPSHDSGYVFRHGPEATSATCAVCHSRESCAACHVNASRVAAIAALGSDPRMAGVVTMRTSGDYRAPPSHAQPDFAQSHGPLAKEAGATCASCHARESCLGCHRTAERNAAIAALPRRSADAAPGVELAAATRPPDHGAGFAVSHRTAASPGETSCASCHAQSFCATCHDGASSPAFHRRNFVERHGNESFGNSGECASCHQPQAFCVNCHVETGRARTGAVAGRYHDAQPAWTFGHGAVARRSIESCAACHREADCLQCHSSSQGWGVNPHGPGFNPGIEKRNMAMCTRCHLNGPPRG